MPPVFLCPVVTIIRCGADRAAKGVFRRQSGRLRCEDLETVEFPVGATGPNDWVEPACAAIRAFRPVGSGKSPAVLVLPPQATLLKHLRIPRVDAHKRARLVAFEAGQNIPGALDEVVWDSTLSGEGEGTHDVLLVAAKLGLLEPLCAAAQGAGFALQRIVPSSLALRAASRLVRPLQKDSELLLNLEPGAAALLLLAGRDFAARSILLGASAAPGLEGLLGHLAPEVTRSLLHFQRQCGLPDPVRLVLAGAGAQSAEIGTALEQRLRIPVQGFEAGGMVAFSSGVRTENFPPELAGAAAVQLLPDQTALNLLPPGLRTRQRRRRRHPGLVAAALLALIAPVVPLVHFYRLAQVAEARSAELDGVIAPLRVREARNRSNLARLAELERQISAWQAVQARRTAWLQFLTDLQDRLTGVEDVWLERMRLVPAAKDEPLKLAVAGRLLERSDPLAKPADPEAFDRVRALLASLKQSPFVGAVEDERFDRSQPGLLAFEFVLVAAGTRPL